jgi:2,3-bisphosphoglycerate-dependent phosphoglycerate mutase
MTRVLLIRHAQSQNNSLPESQRVCDPGLTCLGYRQAAATANVLAIHSIANLFCSPFLRSLETTRLIAEATGLRPEIRSDLFEQGGCYSGYLPGEEKGEPGMGRTQLATRYEGWQIDPHITESGWWGRPYESEEEARRRAHSVGNWLEQKVARPDAKQSALVIHADFKRLLLLQLLGLSDTDPVIQRFGPLLNAGITIVEFTHRSWLLNTYNSHSHLLPDEWSS